MLLENKNKGLFNMTTTAEEIGTRNGKWARDDLEPRVREILDRKLELRKLGPYTARTNDEVVEMLQRAFQKMKWKNVVISDLIRMTGGASKEQFAFTARDDDQKTGERMVLRMDPREGIVQTCRGREAEIQSALDGVVPVPSVRFVDPDGVILGQPGLICDFIEGVTSPTELNNKGVSGIGINYGAWAEKLGPQYVDALVRIHGFDVTRANFEYFTIPEAGTTQAAVQQINWWSKSWWDDIVEPVPIITLTERWLRENAPTCEENVLVHCDFRIGNFMFEEPSGRFTAILDWELCHIGDFHEDLAWTMQKLFGTWDSDGTFLVCGLLPRDQFIQQYEKQSGRKINSKTLRYYEVLNAYKCAVMNLGSGIQTAKHGTNHQDLVLTWLGSAGAVFLDQLVHLLKEA